MSQKRNIKSSEPSAQSFGHNSPKKYSIWQNDSRKIWLALALLIAGLVLTCAAALYVKRGVESIARKEFDFACGEIRDRISTRLHAHAQLLRSGSAFFESADEIKREAWSNFIRWQKIERNLPGIQGIGYAIIIFPDQLALHERKIRNEGFPQYAVKPAGKREIYTSIIYLEPFSERNQRAFGYDMFSEPIRRKAMEHARDFDEATLSGKITLVQETKKDIQAGTLMYVPVYERGLPVRTIEERRRAIRGWVYSPHRMNDLMQEILGAWELGEGRHIRLEVFDDTSFQSEALLYDSSTGQKLELTSATMFSEQTSILFNDHRWSLRFTQVADHTGSIDYSKAWFVLIGGTLVSALLFALYLLLINAGYREYTMAEALTRELRESTERKRVDEALRKSEEKYRTILENIQEGYFEVDLNGNFTFFNDSICTILGYPQEEMMGMHNRQYTDKENLKKLSKTFHKVYKTGQPAKELDWQIIRKDGTKRYIEVSLSLQKNSSGQPIGFQGLARDITDRKMMEAEILALSITDQLTGLYNRRGFLSLAEQQLKLAKRNKSGMLLFFIDMDGLKWINDTVGHEEGDKAIIETATLFKETFRTSDIIARLGGDEYAALAIEITETNSEIITGRLQSLIDTRNNQENRRYRLSISVGYSYYDPENPCSIDELIARADKLMYEQKQKKKSLLPQASTLSKGNPQF
jgi:diguanylate cyclase (GGDEF)-like protein/PAS domain S-box-containing protein